MNDKITQAVNEWYFDIHTDMGVLKITPKEKEQLITKLKQAIADELDKKVKREQRMYDMTKPPKEIDYLNMFRIRIDVLEELKAKLVGE